MTKGMFALLLAGALMVPHVTPAMGTDSTVGLGQGSAPQANGGDLQLPPIPYLDTLRRLDTGARGPKVDTLMGPKLDTLGPFLLEPEIPSASFRKQAETGQSSIRCQPWPVTAGQSRSSIF
jgi:hypothetical protein